MTKMFRNVVMAVAILMLTGCGMIDRGCSKVTGAPSRVCVDGVLYLQFTSGAAVAVDADGKPRSCR